VSVHVDGLIADRPGQPHYGVAGLARLGRDVLPCDSGDHLHPNEAGTRAMADAVDLRVLLRGPDSRWPGSPLTPVIAHTRC
jgi:lysophospholipase L1-like esterase